MSTPVVTDKWAGNFDCSICRRKRLVGSEFSSKALEKYRKSGSALKCKKCVSEQETKEREAAAKRRASLETSGTGSSCNESYTCASCKKSLPQADFNRNQLAKKEKARCRKCVEKAIQNEEAGRKSSREVKIEVNVPVANEKAKTPPIMRNIARIRSEVLVADISPYPTVVKVVTEK